jgi:hypothetical protein
VSVRSSEEYALTALAQPSGPCSTSTSRQEGEGMTRPFGTFGAGGVIFAGGGPTAPGCFGPFTTCTPGKSTVVHKDWHQAAQCRASLL